MPQLTPISLFVEEQLTKFEIENNERNHKKVWRKCYRILKDLKLWDEAETRLIDRKQTKVFNHSTLDQLAKEIEPYLLKRSPIDTEEFEKKRQSNLKLLMNQDPQQIELMDESNQPQTVTSYHLQDFMIKAIFELFYEPIDITQWNKDLAYMHYADTFDEETITSFDFIQTQQRLKNPIKAYTKRKD